MFSNRNLYHFLFLWFVILLQPQLSHSQHLDSTRSLRIGAILPLTGNVAPYGKATQNGILMAKEKLINDGHKIEVIFEDDSLKPAVTLSAFRKLTSIDNVSAVICFASSNCNTISKLADSLGIILIAIASDSRLSLGKKFVFNHWVTPEAENETMISILHKHERKRLAMVTTIQDGALAVRDDLEQRGKGKFEFVFNETYPPDYTDFRSAILKLSQAKPDAIVIILIPGQPGIFARQVRELGVTTPFYSYEMTEDKAEIEASKGALIGTIISTASTGTAEFINLYEKKFNSSFLVGAPNGYDATILLEMAFRLGGDIHKASDLLRTLRDYDGACGRYSATGDNRFGLPAVLKSTEATGFKEFS